jgi:hypothetical protein
MENSEKTDDLKKMDLIKDYNFVKTSVYETSYFQIFFELL